MPVHHSENKQHPLNHFLRQLWSFVHPYRARFFLGLLCGVFYGAINGALLAGAKIVTDLIFNGKTNFHTQLAEHFAVLPTWVRPFADGVLAGIPEVTAPTSELGWALLTATLPGIMLVRNTLEYFSVYLTSWSAMHAIADIRTKLFGHLQNLSLGFFTRASTGDLIARITNDTQILYSIVGYSFSSAVKDPVTVLSTLIVLLALQPTLTLISVIVFPVCLVPIIIYGRKVRKSSRAVQEHNAELTTLMHECFTGNRVIKAYNLEDTVIAEFRATNAKYVGQMMRVLRANEIPSQLIEMFGAAGIALVFFYVQYLPPDRRPTAADFFTFILALVMIYPPVKTLTRLHTQMLQARAASERVFELLATSNSVPEPLVPKPLETAGADIVIEHVTFSFADRKVLDDINLTVRSGQMVALVGKTGSGKTTLANLLLRFYDPEQGSIRIGGVDLKEVSTRDLRNQIAVVAQENILFNDTIGRNIELGRLGASQSEIIAAAKHAYAYEFIMQKKEGFDSVIGEKGVSLSGGQRQRIAIARAVLRRAPILLLDEATSALDTESERAVQTALDELMQGRTTICIAHRLSTILHADLIVVLDQGRIVETGRHEELIAHGGVYQKLYALQFAA